MTLGLFEKAYDLEVKPSKSVSEGMRWGFIIIFICVAGALAHFANTIKLPTFDRLSDQMITPVGFGLVQTKFKNKQNRDTAIGPIDNGYAYIISTKSIPFRYDKATSPDLVGNLNGLTPNTDTLMFHSVLNITKDDEFRLSSLVNKPLTAWFFEGEIIALRDSSEFIISYARANEGVQKQARWYWIFSGILFLSSICLWLYPKLKSA